MLTLACDGAGICQIAGSNECEEISQTNQCINAPTQCNPGIEGNGRKKHKKKRRRKKHR